MNLRRNNPESLEMQAFEHGTNALVKFDVASDAEDKVTAVQEAAKRFRETLTIDGKAVIWMRSQEFGQLTLWYLLGIAWEQGRDYERLNSY